MGCCATLLREPHGAARRGYTPDQPSSESEWSDYASSDDELPTERPRPADAGRWAHLLRQRATRRRLATSSPQRHVAAGITAPSAHYHNGGGAAVGRTTPPRSSHDHSHNSGVGGGATAVGMVRNGGAGGEGGGGATWSPAHPTAHNGGADRRREPTGSTEVDDANHDNGNAVPTTAAAHPPRPSRDSPTTDGIVDAAIPGPSSSLSACEPSPSQHPAQAFPLCLRGPRILTAAQRRLGLERYWGLGVDKWKESIDVHHWKTGRFTYDLCLHGGNGYAREIGYLASMYDAWAAASEDLGYKSSPDSWLVLHERAMGHPGNDFLNGKFRNLCQGNRAYVAYEFPGCEREENTRGRCCCFCTTATSGAARDDNVDDAAARRATTTTTTTTTTTESGGKGTGMTKRALREFATQLPRNLCYVGRSDDARYAAMRCMPPIKRRTMRNYVRRYLHDFYADVGCIPTWQAAQFPERANASSPSQSIHPSSSLDPSIGENRRGDRAPPHDNNGDLRNGDFTWVKGWPPPEETVVTAIARLQQRLSRMEPSRDGNTRTSVVLINKLLCECGLTPAIFLWPDGAAIADSLFWKGEIREGMSRWRDARAALLALPAAAARHTPESVAEQSTRTVRSPYRGVDWAVKFLSNSDDRLLIGGGMPHDESAAAGGGGGGDSGSVDATTEPNITLYAPPPRAAFVCPVGIIDRTQRNAYFSD